MIRFTISLCIIVLALSCQQDKPSKQDTFSTEEQSPQTENPDQIASLYEHFTNNPRTQAQKDENAIIEYLGNQSRSFKRYPNGLYVHIKKQGTGSNYLPGQKTLADYKGYTLDEKVFDSSFKRGKPLRFTAGQMIPGWTQIQYEVSPGAELTVIIPSHLGYGEQGFPGAVAPNTVIAFDVIFRE